MSEAIVGSTKKRRKSGPLPIPQNLRTCPRCGKQFYAFPSLKVKCCSKSCGMRRHGETATRLYSIWCNMRRRCNGTNPHHRKYYAGITVCDEWGVFESFKHWALSNGYREDLTIDRIKNANGYSPDNCRWATRGEQSRNTRKRRDAKTSRFKGVSRHSQQDVWIAQGHREQRPINLGSFKTELGAALAYDDWAADNYGEFACINFPERKEVLIVAS